MHITSCATLGLMLFTLTLMVHVLFTRKHTPAWPLFALEWHSRWLLCKVVKYSIRLLTSPISITSHTEQVSLNSPSSSCMCSYLGVLTLCVAIFSLLTLFRQLFLTQIFLRYLALDDQNHLLGHILFRCCCELGTMALHAGVVSVPFHPGHCGLEGAGHTE